MFCFDVATFQMLLFASHVMYSPRTLPKHAWDYSKTKVWADATTGESTDVWSRGTGWYMMALADVLTYLPASHANYAAMLALFQKMATGVAAAQIASSGLWYQVVDKPSYSGNWTESSGSGMFVYALKKGVDNGWLDGATYTPIINKGWTGLQTQIATLTDGPQIKQFCVATGAANSTAAYIALGKTNCPTGNPPVSGTQHPHGYCAILMAASVMEYAFVNQPPAVTITSPAGGTSFTAPATVTLNATASDTDGTISKVEFFQGSTKIGEATSSPFTFNWTSVPAGSYSLTAKASDNLGLSTTSANVGITVLSPSGGTILSKRIDSGPDDAEEFSNGTVTLTSYALELAYYSSKAGNQVTGLRFNNITIPAGTTIKTAYIQFNASKTNYSTSNLIIKGELSPNSPAFVAANRNLSGRAVTSANAIWTPVPWTLIGEESVKQQTSDLKTIVQEIIGQPYWTSGNSMSFILTGSATRTAYSFEGSSGKAALLHIEY